MAREIYLGLLAIASQIWDFTFPKSVDAIVGPALLILFLVGIAGIVIGAKMMKRGM